MIDKIGHFQGVNITFHVTEDCNLRCKYCYECNKRPRTLPLEYGEKFIDLLLRDKKALTIILGDLRDSLPSNVILDFIGGDALMHPKLCDDILSYFSFQSVLLRHPWANRWRASISTNGTLFGKPGVKDFLEKWKGCISLGVSIDGCPEIHDKNRVTVSGKGSMNLIMKEWDWYTKYVSKELLSTKATCNRDSILYLYKSLKFMHEDLGINQINMNFIFEDMDLTEKDYKELDKQYEKCVEYILEHHDDLYVSMFDLNRMALSSPMKDKDKGWCGSGSMPCLSVNGHIYPCFRFCPVSTKILKKETNTGYSVGNIWNGWTNLVRFTEIQNCTREKISPPKCFDCNVESGCSWCIAGGFSETGVLHRQTHICEIHKLQTKWARVYWIEYEKKNKWKSKKPIPSPETVGAIC